MKVERLKKRAQDRGQKGRKKRVDKGLIASRQEESEWRVVGKRSNTKGGILREESG